MAGRKVTGLRVGKKTYTGDVSKKRYNDESKLIAKGLLPQRSSTWLPLSEFEKLPL